MNEESRLIIAEMKEIGKMLNDKIEEVRTELKEEIQQVRQRVDKVEEKLDVVAEDVEYVKLQTDVIVSTIKLHDTEIGRLKFNMSRFKKAE